MARRRPPATVEDISDRLNREMEGSPLEDEGEGETRMHGTAGHNSKVRAHLIQKLARDLAAIDAEAKELGGRRAEVSAQVRGDLGMTVKGFRIAYGIFMLPQEQQDESIDHLKECFRALGIGQQGSLFPDLPSDADEAAAPAE